MAGYFRQEESELVNSSMLDQEKLDALNDSTRIEILELLADTESYPSEIAKKLDIDRQKAYYHFNVLEEAGLIEEAGKEEKSGGTATFYRPKSTAYVLDLGGGGKKVNVPEADSNVLNFLHPLVEDGELNGSMVVGSPDQHGPDQVRARDGHLAGEIGMKLGSYCTAQDAVKLDTEIFNDSSFENNLLMIGGIMTNTVTKKFNEYFSASFSGEEFPYREIQTPESSYSEDAIGVIAKTEHPEDSEKALYMVAGIRNSGTEAAVRAFKDLESIIHDYEQGDYYRIVRGRDMDGDGKIDSYEVVE